jgi:hypothetical protein
MDPAAAETQTKEGVKKAGAAIVGVNGKGDVRVDPAVFEYRPTVDNWIRNPLGFEDSWPEQLAPTPQLQENIYPTNKQDKARGFERLVTTNDNGAFPVMRPNNERISGDYHKRVENKNTANDYTDPVSQPGYRYNYRQTPSTWMPAVFTNNQRPMEDESAYQKYWDRQIPAHLRWGEKKQYGVQVGHPDLIQEPDYNDAELKTVQATVYDPTQAAHQMRIQDAVRMQGVDMDRVEQDRSRKNIR